MSRFLKTLTIAFVAGMAWPVLAAPQKVIMETPHGTEVYITPKKAKESQTELAEATISGVQLRGSKKLCNSHAQTDLFEQATQQQELTTLIKSLIKRKKHQQAVTPTAVQKKVLKSTPPCEPFLVELNVIARLVQGYDITKSYIAGIGQ